MIETDARGSRAHVTISDRGAGIAADHVAQIFEPYFTTKRSGTGLGLPIARNIVEGLGGTIAVRVVAPGTIVDLDLPLRPPGQLTVPVPKAYLLLTEAEYL